MPSERASLDLLVRTPFIQILTYPRISLPVARARIKQLQKLEVEELIFEGRVRIGRLGVLGLGTVGVVVRASAGGRDLALKIRRTDANRPNMDEEARLTEMVNRLDIGPAVVSHSKDFILMQLLEFQELIDWLKGLEGPGKRQRARELVHSILNQCRKLDIMGVDHGQLSNLRKHAVVADERPWIIDFESAGTSRRPRNVTTAAQYLLVGGRLSPLMRRTLGIKDRESVVRLLSAYKADMTDYTYAKLLEHLRIA